MEKSSGSNPAGSFNFKFISGLFQLEETNLSYFRVGRELRHEFAGKAIYFEFRYR